MILWKNKVLKLNYNVIDDNRKICPYDDKCVDIEMCNDCFFYNDCYIDNDVLKINDDGLSIYGK